MFGPKTKKEKPRFYLLPGMGGRAYHRKQKVIVRASVIVGLLISLVIAALLYYFNRVRS